MQTSVQLRLLDALQHGAWATALSTLPCSTLAVFTKLPSSSKDSGAVDATFSSRRCLHGRPTELPDYSEATNTRNTSSSSSSGDSSSSSSSWLQHGQPARGLAVHHTAWVQLPHCRRTTVADQLLTCSTWRNPWAAQVPEWGHTASSSSSSSSGSSLIPWAAAGTVNSRTKAHNAWSDPGWVSCWTSYSTDATKASPRREGYATSRANSTPNTTSSGSNSSSSSSSGGGPSGSWVERHLPPGAQPYAHLMRLDKPIGSWLLAWPGLWSIALAADPGHLPDLWYSSLFAVGAVLLRGAGCTVNDLWDRDIDRKVERTRTRPLAAGQVTPFQALVFLGGQLSLGLAILLQLNTCTQVLGASSLLLVATYPLMKRVTHWPQAFLGCTINWGALMGWAAVRGSCDWGVVLPLYLAGINWSLVYDTIYAHQDKHDDKKVGVKSTALLFGQRTKPVLAGFAAAQTAALLLAGHMAGCGAVQQVGVALAATHQAWQILAVDLEDRPDCMAKFVSNKWYGAIVYASIVADRLLLPAA